MISTRRLITTFLGVATTSIVLTLLVTAGILQLRNDDGVFYQGSFAGRIKGDIDGAVFHPGPAFFPITIQAVDFAFHRPGGADDLADSVRVRVQIYAMEDGMPGDLLAESAPQTFTTLDAWLSIPLDLPLTLEEPASFMAAVKWESGNGRTPALSLATDFNLEAPQDVKNQANLFHDADLVLGTPACQDGFCPHSVFWGNPARVGFNMIRVTIDSPLDPTETPAGPSPTDTPATMSPPIMTTTPTVVTPTGTPPAAPSGTPTLPTATATPTACVDVTGDGRGDMADVQAMAQHWRARSTDQDWNAVALYDWDGDGIITASDIMRAVAQNGCAVATATPTPSATATESPTATTTPPPVPAGRDNLTAKVFIDYRCDRFVQNGVDTLLPDVPVTLSFPNGAEETRRTTSFGAVYFAGFDASGGVSVSVDLSVGHKGRSLGSCANSPSPIELQPDDFQSGNKFVQFGAEILGETAAP